MGNDFVGLNEAARQLRVSPAVLRRRVRRGELPAFATPLDERAKLLRREEVEALMIPRTIEPREGSPPPAA